MKKKIFSPFITMLLVVLIGMSACAPQNTPAPSAAPVHWTYEGEERTSHWGALDPAKAFDPFVNNLPAEKSDVIDAGVKINAADLLPSVQTTFRYSGSLTTPPCSEGVSWLVMTTPVELSSGQ